jgi:hypothetical protein
MDDIVAQAMARWPDVPAVYGWLRLDRRGRWLVKDEPIGHRPTVEFIGRNYLCDAHGRHYFQNGPQRVFVDIDHFPHVLHIEGGPVPDGTSGTDVGRCALVTHAGTPVVQPSRAWVHPDHGVIVAFDWPGSPLPALGSVLDRDLPALVESFSAPDGNALDADAWECLLHGRLAGARLSIGGLRVAVEPLPAGFESGFVRAPRPAPGEDACT